jgi:predicted lipoprotein
LFLDKYNKRITMTLSNISVEQYMKMLQIEKMFAEDFERQNIEIAKLFMSDLSILASEQLAFEVREALKEEPRFIRRFEMNGKSWGFIPNLDKMSTAEYLDLKLYDGSEESFHKMLSILYRPVKKKISFRKREDMYSIEDYEGTKYADDMKQVSVEVLLGALKFFFLLFESLNLNLAISLEKQRLKIINSISDQKKNLI